MNRSVTRTRGILLLIACLLSPLTSGCSLPSAPTAVTAASTVPALSSPPEGAELDNGCLSRTDPQVWEFDWSDVRAATRYQLFVQRVSSAFPVINTVMLSSSYTHSSPGAYVIDGNRFNWQWKVRAELNGTVGEYSQTRTFSVEPLNTDCQ